MTAGKLHTILLEALSVAFDFQQIGVALDDGLGCSCLGNDYYDQYCIMIVAARAHSSPSEPWFFFDSFRVVGLRIVLIAVVFASHGSIPNISHISLLGILQAPSLPLVLCLRGLGEALEQPHCLGCSY